MTFGAQFNYRQRSDEYLSDNKSRQSMIQTKISGGLKLLGKYAWRICQRRCASFPFSVICLGAILSGCAAFPPKGESIVFGKAELPPGLDKGMWATVATVNVINAETSKIIERYTLKEKEREFYWNFRPGRYAICSINVSGMVGLGSQMRTWRSFAEFSVPASGSAIYIGTLDLQTTNSGITVVVKDEYETAAEHLKTKYPAFAAESKKQLIKLEKIP
jgi:hypothetical protein